MPKPGFISFAFILRCCMFCLGCMIAFVVLYLVIQYIAKRLAEKNVFPSDLFYVGWDVKP